MLVKMPQNSYKNFCGLRYECFPLNFAKCLRKVFYGTPPVAVSGKGPNMVLTGINQQDLSCKTCSKLARETYISSVASNLFKVINNDTGTIFRPLF